MPETSGSRPSPEELKKLIETQYKHGMKESQRINLMKAWKEYQKSKKSTI